MARYRVGETGLRVITARGTYSLPPGVVLYERPEQYEGTLEMVEWDEQPVRKRLDGYEDKRVHPAEDK